MIALMSKQMIRPFEFRGRTFDCGAPAGFVSANLHMALARADLGAHVNLEIETLAAARSAVA